MTNPAGNINDAEDAHPPAAVGTSTTTMALGVTGPGDAAEPAAPEPSQQPRRRSRRGRWLLPALVAASIGLAFGACVVAARSHGWLEYVELKALDVLIRHGPRDGSCVDQVLVIGIDETDLKEPGFNYPVPDGKMAELLERLIDHGAASVALDVYRDRPVGDRVALPGPLAGQAFYVDRRAELRRVWGTRSVVSVFEIGSDPPTTTIRPPPDLPEDQVGFADFPLDPDGVIRRGSLFLQRARPGPPDVPDASDAGPPPYLSLSLQAVLYAFGPTGSFDPGDDGARLGGGYLPFVTGPTGAYPGPPELTSGFLLDFRTPEDRLRVRNARDVLSGRVTRADIEGRVVLVGMTAASTKDFLETAIGTRPGVVVHAMAVDQLLRVAAGRPGTRVLNRAAEGGLVMLVALAGSALGLLVRRPIVLAGLTAAGLAVVLAAGWEAFHAGWWVFTVPPAVAWVAAAGLTTAYVSNRDRSDRLAMAALFTQHVSPDVASMIWDNRGAILAGGRIQPRRLECATALFTDLEGFSGVTERLKPDEVLEWLNELMTELAGAVKAHDGFVNKYMGDALMAVFGAPLPRTTRAEHQADALQAVRCALAMRAAFARLRDRWTGRGMPPVRMRVGVFSGEAVAGSIGGAGRLEYTVTGRAVNTAARLEQFDKSKMDGDIAAGGCRILIGQPTQDLIAGHVRTRLVAADVSLRGIATPTDVYGVIG